MNPSLVRALGLGLTLGYAGFIGWLYVVRPQNLSEMKGGMAAAVGLYEIDRLQFEQARSLFRTGHYPEARAAFSRADPAQRDAATQFYVAYTFYRQGWGRIYNDGSLFTQALAALDKAVALSPQGHLSVSDPDLGLPDSDALRAELEHGLKIELKDFNPLRLLRTRQ